MMNKQQPFKGGSAMMNKQPNQPQPLPPEPLPVPEPQAQPPAVPTAPTDVFQSLAKLLDRKDFVEVQGRLEITRDGLLKLLTALPFGYSIELINEEITNDYVKVQVRVEIQIGNVVRRSTGTGICDRASTRELHFAYSKAETRALKRALENLLGAIINQTARRLLAQDQPQSQHQKPYKSYGGGAKP